MEKAECFEIASYPSNEPAVADIIRILNFGTIELM
jgi:hypothetical protein